MKSKSLRNYSTAIWARNQEFYDVAISRYYYSAFQLIIYILKNNNCYKRNNARKDSHIFTFKLFMDFVSKNQPTDLTVFSALGALKKMRVKSDYRDEKIDRKFFIEKFMKQFTPIYSKLQEYSQVQRR